MLQEFKLVASVYELEELVNNPPLAQDALDLKNISRPAIIKADSITEAAYKFMNSEEFELFSSECSSNNIWIYYYENFRWIHVSDMRHQQPGG